MSSLQIPNNKYIHIVYISIIASLLLGATVGPSLLRAAAQEDDTRILEVLCNSYGEGVDVTRGGRSERISFSEWLADFRPGLVDLFSEVGCAGISDTQGVILRRANVGVFVDSVPAVNIKTQAVGPHTINTETTVGEYSGDVAGTLACTRTVIVNVDEARFTGTAICNFVGRVLGSDSGSMTKIFSFDGPFGGPVPGTVQFSQGVGGLQGICGGGTFLNVAGEVFYDYVFAFGDDCDDLDMSDFLDALEEEDD